MPTTFNKEEVARNLQFWRQVEYDTVLIAGSEELRIPAHRYILSKACEYFNAMFATLMYERISNEVKMPSVDGEILQGLVQYCYTGRVEIREDIVVELLETADMLLLSDVVTACGEFLAEQLHPSNCLGLTLFAERYRCPFLLQKAKDYTLENFMAVCKSDEFLKLNANQLSQLLICDNICVSAEQEIFNCIMAWIEHDQAAREKHKYELLKSVRMPLLEKSFLMENVKAVCTSIDCHQLYGEAIAWHLLPDRNTTNATQSTKPRKLYQFLMAITLSKSKNSMHIHYYCPRRLKWMKWFKDLEYREFFSIAIMDENLFIVGGYDVENNVLNTVIRLNLKTMNVDQMIIMKEHRVQCSSVVLKGFLYVVGGFNANRAFCSVEKWCPKANTWYNVASMRVSHAAFYSPCSVRPAEYSDQCQNVWGTIEKYRSSPFHGVGVANGQLYVVDESKTATQYIPEINRWTKTSSILTFDTITCTMFPDKPVLCYSERVKEYNITISDWGEGAPLTGLNNISAIFTYSNKLMLSAFAEN